MSNLSRAVAFICTLFLMTLAQVAAAQATNASLLSYVGTNLTTTTNPNFANFKVSLSGGNGGTMDAYIQSTYGITNTSNQAYGAMASKPASANMNFVFSQPIVMFNAYAVSLYNAPQPTYTVYLKDGTQTTTKVPAGSAGGVNLSINATSSNPIVRVDLASGCATVSCPNSGKYYWNVTALQYQLASTSTTTTTTTTTTTSTTNGWTQIGTGMTFTSASIGSATSFGGISGGQYYAWNGTSFVADGIALAQVAYGSDGDRWGVASNYVIYHRGASWATVPGGLKQISVGNASNVWGATTSGQLYKWTGTTWTQMPGAAVTTAVGADGTVWVLNSADQIFRWNGSGWTQVPGGLRWISVGGATNVWGVNAGGFVYKFNAASGGWDMPAVPSGGTYIGVSTASDGTTLLVRNDGTLWKK